ncbi:MAG: tetratricopeptide repeat protein [bacterium]
MSHTVHSQTFQKAVSNFQAGQYQAAIALLKQIDVKNGDGQYLLALCYDRLGNGKASEKAFRRALKTHSQPYIVSTAYAAMLRRAGRYEEALRQIERAIGMKPDVADIWFEKAMIYDAVGNLSGAEEAYRHTLQLKPDHAIALSNLGSVYNRQERFDEALETLNQAVALRLNHPHTHSYRANALTELGQLEEALADQTIALRAMPDNAVILAGFARGNQRLGKNPEALAAYNRAIAGQPDDVQLHRDYNRLLWEMGQRQNFLASFDWAVTVTARDTQAELHLAKGDLARMMGRLDIALAAYDAAIALSADANGLALDGRARVYALQENQPAAAKDHRAAMAAAPDQWEIRHGFAEFLLSQGQFHEAIDVLDRTAPTEHLQRHIGLLALAYRAMGDERYRQWYDYDAFTTMLEITVPDAWSSLPSFLAAVEEELEPLFDRQQAPLDQTLFNGVQSPGDLWDFKTPAISALRLSLQDTVRHYVAGLSLHQDHPFTGAMLKAKKAGQGLDFTGAWSVKLTSGGGHVDHIHPDGWISTANYIHVPRQMATVENDKAGWLRLGASGVQGLDLPAEKYIRPESGHLIIFPSYIWHGVEPFQSDEARITTPFDMNFR